MDQSLSLEYIAECIFIIRGQKVMLDFDLASLYGVSTRRLNEQVTRNIQRFPTDFMFQLTREEFQSLMSQFATSNVGRGGRRKFPRVFTQEGVAMLSGVLNSERAIEVNIGIMRTFVKLREVLATHKELTKRLDEIEEHLAGHESELGKQAQTIRTIFKTIRHLMVTPEKPRKRIGFLAD